MTALPMTLEDTLRYQGFTIDATPTAAFDVAVTEGVIHVPAMVLGKLNWARPDPVTPELGADLYLSELPIFDATYHPVLLSNILDHFRTRRLGYNTPGEWMLAFRRWGNLNMPFYNLRYRSTAVALPLDDRDESDVTAATRHGLDIESDFPQSLISDSTDYASTATDRRAADNVDLHRTGRGQSIAALLIEQRTAYLNIDAEIISDLESLFLGTFDMGEGMRRPGQYNYPFNSYPTHYYDTPDYLF